MRRGKGRGEEAGTAAATVVVVAEWESKGRESEGWLKVKNEKNKPKTKSLSG